MDTTDFKPNSHMYKNEEKKRVEKVVKGSVKTKKKTEIKKFADVFVSEDVHSVGSYIVMDVLVPTIKKAIVDIVTDGVNMLFFGDSGKGRKSNGNASYVSYRSYSDRNNNGGARRSERSRSRYSYDDIVLDSRGEAEDVLERMDELVDMYGSVTVADMYDLVGITGNYTDNKYGWTNIRNAEVIHVRDGYMLKLPKALPID